MGSEWSRTTLGQVTEIISGGTPRKARTEYWGGSTPWVSAKDLKTFRLDDAELHVTEAGLANGTRLAPPGTVFMLVRGMTLLREVPISVAMRPMAFNQDVKALNAASGVLPSYLPYLLLGNRERLHSLVDLAGHGTGRLNTDEVRALPVLLPPRSEQRAIAHALGTFDDRIELNRRTSETLEGMARTLFKSWFVDFEPVRAKMDGRWRRGESLPGMPADLYDAFPDLLVDSEIGEVPEGWEVAALGDHLSIERGLSYTGKHLADNGLAMHNLNSIFEGGGYKYDGIKYYAGKYRDRHRISAGDLIVANTEQGHDRLLIGHAAIIPAVPGAGIFSHHLYQVAAKDESPLTGFFLYHLLNSPRMHQVVSGYANGTTVNMLPTDALQIPPFVAPPEALVREFDGLAAAAHSRQEVLIGEADTLTHLRDALLPKLISGELPLEAAIERIEVPA